MRKIVQMFVFMLRACALQASSVRSVVLPSGGGSGSCRTLLWLQLHRQPVLRHSSSGTFLWHHKLPHHHFLWPARGGYKGHTWAVIVCLVDASADFLRHPSMTTLEVICFSVTNQRVRRSLKVPPWRVFVGSPKQPATTVWSTCALRPGWRVEQKRISWRTRTQGTFNIHLMLCWGSSGRLEQYMHQHDNIPLGSKGQGSGNDPTLPISPKALSPCSCFCFMCAHLLNRVCTLCYNLLFAL